MKRTTRIQWADETVAICKIGHYTLPNGNRVQISDEIKAAVRGTILYGPSDCGQFPPPTGDKQTHIEVTNETTTSALYRLKAAGRGSIGCLNFASARNPGGGFLNGSEAQEESLARASALYPCLLSQEAYYAQNRANRSALYLDLMIFSPNVPFFRDDGGALLPPGEAKLPVNSQLPTVTLASVITAPAPNAGAIAANEPHNAKHIEATLRRRADMVLAIAGRHGVKHLVLGAWGCGVFRNDPALVASIFANLLLHPGKYSHSFETVVFAVLDRSPEQGCYKAFSALFR